MSNPGWKTTEFWFAVFSALASIAVAAGWIDAEQVDPLVQVFVMIAMAIISAFYSSARAKVKAAA